ncbi:MAG: AAA family ATPase [Dehalococcoidia bacterium]
MTNNGIQPDAGITAITVQGFKSLYDETRVEIRPLTILAGANSSGKSSTMQPLLLLKQTLEAPYDPGPLQLDGPILHFSAVEQFLSKTSTEERAEAFKVSLELHGARSLTDEFRRSAEHGLDLAEMRYHNGAQGFVLRSGMSREAAALAIPPSLRGIFGGREAEGWHWEVDRFRCFFGLRIIADGQEAYDHLVRITRPFEEVVLKLVHVPALPRSAQRSFPIAAIGSQLPGAFEHYVGSLVNDWQAKGDARQQLLCAALEKLGLTGQIQARQIDATQVEVLIGRLPKRGRSSNHDFVNIADAGSGVRQILPVLVALLVAEPGQMVYLEEPEQNLHPRAEWLLAEVLADAANRGVQVVVETHSSLLLFGVEALVAEGKLGPQLVKLHWFSRDKNGATKVTLGELDGAGTFGEWPEDFGDVEMEAQGRFLDASGAVQWKQAGAG